MILVISILSDQATNITCEYLNLLEVNYLRINAFEELLISKIEIKNRHRTIELEYKGRKFSIEEVSLIWYRNGHLFNVFLQKVQNGINAETDYLNFHNDELKVLNKFVFEILEKKKMFGSFTKGSPNKILMLEAAAKAGLNIPYTIISSQKEKICSILLHKKLIKKPLNESRPVKFRDNIIVPYTKEVSLNEEQNNGESSFFPTLFQELVDSIFEVKCFFIKQNVFSMAIFRSANNKNIDWKRMENGVDYNRYIPFKLPNRIKMNVLKFTKHTKLNIGSIDFLVTKNMKFYFLEVNPVGQYNFISTLCNYGIEKRIAKILKYYEEK